MKRVGFKTRMLNLADTGMPISGCRCSGKHTTFSNKDRCQIVIKDNDRNPGQILMLERGDQDPTTYAALPTERLCAEYLCAFEWTM
jgi:hypothetical protein